MGSACRVRHKEALRLMMGGDVMMRVCGRCAALTCGTCMMQGFELRCVFNYRGGERRSLISTCVVMLWGS